MNTKYESLLQLDFQIRNSGSKSQIQKVIFEYIKLLVKLKKLRITFQEIEEKLQQLEQSK